MKRLSLLFCSLLVLSLRVVVDTIEPNMPEACQRHCEKYYKPRPYMGCAAYCTREDDECVEEARQIFEPAADQNIDSFPHCSRQVTCECAKAPIQEWIQECVEECRSRSL